MFLHDSATYCSSCSVTFFGGLMDSSHLVAFRNGTSLPREGLAATPLGDGDTLEIHAAASGG